MDKEYVSSKEVVVIKSNNIQVVLAILISLTSGGLYLWLSSQTGYRGIIEVGFYFIATTWLVVNYFTQENKFLKVLPIFFGGFVGLSLFFLIYFIKEDFLVRLVSSYLGGLSSGTLLACFLCLNYQFKKLLKKE